MSNLHDMGRYASWDKSILPRPIFFIKGKEVSETTYRRHLRMEGRTDKEIELFFKMVRDIWLGGD